MEVTATIKNARIVYHFGRRRLLGQIFNDTQERFEDGTIINTSPIKKGNVGDKYVTTKHSVYQVEWEKEMFEVGDKVSKVGGDYTFDGVVVAVFTKLSGAMRLVVEDDRGVLHVYSEKNLKMRTE